MMEHRDAHKLEHDREGSSRRRLSSILKAPRPSMKVLGNDQDENQEETRTIDKRRSSRRVSFSTTNNIHVFPKDIKAIPVLAPIKGSAIGLNERQNEKVQCLDPGEKLENTGMDSTIIPPLYFSQNKENFFPEPILPCDSVDRTVLFGENAGCMDTTCTQTSAIETKDRLDQEWTLNMSNVGKPRRLGSQSGRSCNMAGTTGKRAMHSEFNDFLSSLSKASSPHVSVSFPKKMNNNFTFEPLHVTSNANVDKENILPTCLSKSAPVEMDQMDMTNSHTIIIEEPGTFPYSAGGNRITKSMGSSSNYLDDMELTHCQTATFNFKGMETSNPSMPSVDQKSCTFNCDDTSEMSLTEVLDEHVEDRKQRSEQNKAAHFQSNAVFVPTAGSDDMEVTRSHTVVIEPSYVGEPSSKANTVSSFRTSSNANRKIMNTIQTGNDTPGAIVSEIGGNKSNMSRSTHTALLCSDRSDIMEMTRQASTRLLCPGPEDSVLTGCGNIAIDSKRISVENLLGSKPQVSFTQPPPSDVKKANRLKREHAFLVDDSEKTRHTLCDDMEMTQCHTVGDLERTHHTACDMEMTRCHTVGKLKKTHHTTRDLEKTQYLGAGDLNKTTITACDDMDMTECHTAGDLTRLRRTVGDMEKTRYTVCDDMEMTQCHTAGGDVTKLHHTVCDMEMTQCHTIHGVAETCHTGNLEKTRHTICDDMEMTGCHTAVGDLTKLRHTACDMEKTRTVGDDMEVTQCHTIHGVAETRHAGDLEKTHHTICDNMEMTECHTAVGDLTKLPHTACDMEKTRTVGDDMEVTQCHTIHGVAKARHAGDLEKTCHTICDDMEMTECLTAGGDLTKLHHTICDMEMTQCHTMLGAKKTHHVGDLEITRHTISDMETTRCHTGVLEPVSCDDFKPSHKSMERVSLVLRSFRPEAMHEDSRFSKRAKTENCMLPTAQDRSDSREMRQGPASDMSDDMELTGYRDITTDTKTLWGTIPSNKAHSASCGLPSRSTNAKTRRSEAFFENVGAGDASSRVSVMDLDTGNLVDKKTKTVSDVAGKDLIINQTAGTKTPHQIYEPSSCYKASLHSTIKNTSEEDCPMEMTGALDEQCCAASNQRETVMEIVKPPVTSSQKVLVEMDHTQPMNKIVAVTPTKDNSVFESDIKCSKTEHSSAVKSRQRSLSDLQDKLQTISQHMHEPDGLLAGSNPAQSGDLSVASPAEKISQNASSVQPSQESPLFENNDNADHKACVTPFNLKNSLIARLSVGNIVPKFPQRVSSSSPHPTAYKSPNVLRGFQPHTRFHPGSHESGLFDEEPPEDFSGSSVGLLSNNNDEQEVAGVHWNENDVEHGHMESAVNTSQSEKMPPEVKDATMKETCKKLRGSDDAAQITSTRVDDTSSNSSSTTVKCEGITELSLRNSQMDSQIDGTIDDEFDFYKKLEEGSVTVNEFLTHFGAKFVIHRSRPSALPNNFRAAQTYTIEDLLKEKHIHRPKQKVYGADCQKLSEMADEFKMQMDAQDEPLRSMNGTLLQDVCTFSKEQLHIFGVRLKERRAYFRKRSKALSHKMKENLYSELLTTTKEAKQSLMSKIKETNEMIKDIDGCINDMESELIGMNNIIFGERHSEHLEPVLKAKHEQLDALNSQVTEKEKEIAKLELQAQSLEETWKKAQDESREIECRTADLSSLNEWQLKSRDKNGLVFTFLHDTFHLEVKHKMVPGNDCIQDDGLQQDVNASFKFLLNAESSQPSAIMIHRLLRENINSQSKWMQKFSSTRNIPMLLHDVSLVVSRLRLLGEEIHRLKRWGGLRFGILRIDCVDALIEVTISSLRAFVKFDVSLMISPHYPFRPLQLHKFQNHIGHTRLEQIQDIISSIKPGKHYLTTVMKRIHSDLLS